MTPPPAKKETREEILRASQSLFATQGFEAVSMRDIAAAVGVQPSALYYYYVNKQQLHLAVMNHAFSGAMSRSLAALTGNEAPLLRLKRFVAILIQDLNENPEILLLMQRERLANDPVRLRLLVDEVFAKPLSALIETVKAVSPDRDPLMMAASVSSLVMFFFETRPLRRLMPGWRIDHESPEVLIQHVADLLDSIFAIQSTGNASSWGGA